MLHNMDFHHSFQVQCYPSDTGFPPAVSGSRILTLSGNQQEGQTVPREQQTES